MKIISTNIAKPTTISFNDKKEKTGYLKKPVDFPIFLGKNGVLNDTVSDLEHHGGIDKAVYIYGLNNYDFWKTKYPDLEFQYGMFGENLSVDFVDESNLKIGDVFKVGEAIIQITQPRQPCYKMGIKFNTQKVVKEFRLSNFPGIYVRVLQQGYVKQNDIFTLTETHNNTFTVLEIYKLIYEQKPDLEIVEKVLDTPYIAENIKQYLIKKINYAKSN